MLRRKLSDLIVTQKEFLQRTSIVELRCSVVRMCECLSTPPRFRRDYPLNLSISLSGGKESKSDSLSSGERKGRSPAQNLPGYQARGEMLRIGKGRL